MTRVLALALAIACLAPGLRAQHLVATRPIPANTILSPGDLVQREATVPGALAALEEAVGQETRVSLYPGQPVHGADVGPPALVERNQIVTLRFARGPLRIETEGRALGRAAAGERVRVMNLASRATVCGTVQGPGLVGVGR